MSAFAPPAVNDVSARQAWFRHEGDSWDCYDSLPAPVRQRLQAHAYDAWSVNALKLWRLFRRRHGGSARALPAMLNQLDRLEAMERAAFDEAHRRRHRAPLPHVAAGVSVLRRA